MIIYRNFIKRIYEILLKPDCRETEMRMTNINSPMTGGETGIPIGGVKLTGIGEREQGSIALGFYTELKVVYVDYTGHKREVNLY